MLKCAGGKSSKKINFIYECYSFRRNVMKDLVKVIQEESYTYQDPITSFIEDLYVNFDFDGAQKKLRDCETVLINDFFLVACLDDFVENSRMMIFETFCRIHQCISIRFVVLLVNVCLSASKVVSSFTQIQVPLL